MKHDCQIIVCGDICVTPDTIELFESGNASALFKGLLSPFKESDILIGNLEFPLTDSGNGIKKCGPVLNGKTKCISAFKNAGFNLLGMANNHIRDCGNEGVSSTLESCRNSGIHTVGAGANSFAAGQPALLDVKGWKIGVMAFAEHEFNVAQHDRAGANLFDPYESFDQIKAFRAECDYLILLYHGGIEHYAYPSPMLQKKCRKMIASGVDLVLCQHSHCIGSFENYEKGTIVYGQGNTVFGHRDNDQAWNEGLVVRISLTEKTPLKSVIDYIPIRADHAGIDLMPSSQAESVLQAYHDRSIKAGDILFVQESWQKFCNQRKSHYLPHLLGLGRIINYANRKLNNGIVNLLYTKKDMRIIMNLNRCEAHHEVVQTILESGDKE